MHILEKNLITRLLLAGLGVVATGVLHAEENTSAQTLPSIEVASTRDRQQAINEIRRHAGGVGIRFGEDYRQGVVIGIADALATMPGVYAQRLSGQEAAKLSIRGSGIAASNIRGIRLLRDGLPLARLDDLNEGTYADAMSAQRIEVYRGASSLQYGAAVLGGAINLISPTAYNTPGTTLRMEAGAHGFRRAQLKGGKVFDGGLDAYAAVTHYEADGFRENSAERSSRLYANIGYAFSATSRGRFHLTEERYNGEMPGTITLSQALEQPQMANPSNKATNARIRTSPRWHLAYQHEWDLAQSDKLSVGAFYTGTKFDSPTPMVRALYDATDYGVALRHEINRSIAGQDNRLVWGLNAGRGNGDNSLFIPGLFLPPATFIPASAGTVQDRRSQIELFAENTYRATDRLALVAGLQASRASRSIINDTPVFNGMSLVTEYPKGTAARAYTSLNPKLGAILDLGGSAQLYANVSRNHEAPASLVFFTPSGTLKQQRATTLEVGTRGGTSAFTWDVALYHSKVKDELLALTNMISPVLPAINVNATGTTKHDGLEVGLQGVQAMPTWNGSLDWSVTYGWNHFRFGNTTQYAGNKLPGIPDHVLQAGLVYRHASGFYVGPNVMLGSSWYADQANTVQAPGYGVLNLGAGYVARQGYRIFIDARNVGDKRYVPTSTHLVDARTQPANVFRPGQPRSLFVGVETHW